MSILLAAGTAFAAEPLIQADRVQIERAAFDAVRTKASLSSDAPLRMMSIWYSWLPHGSNFYFINPAVTTNPPSERITVRVRVEDTIRSRPTDAKGLGEPDNATKFEWSMATVEMSLAGTIIQVNIGEEAAILPNTKLEQTQPAGGADVAPAAGATSAHP